MHLNMCVSVSTFVSGAFFSGSYSSVCLVLLYIILLCFITIL